LGSWKWHYGTASVLLIIGIFIRSLEPKILQIAVDNVVVFYHSNGLDGAFGQDFVSRFFYAILPHMSINNLAWVLGALGLVYLGLAVLRGSFLLAASALNASSAENAVKQLRDRIFRHIQRLPMSYHSNITTGELIQRSTGDIDTVRKFLLNQVVEVIRLIALFGFSLLMMLIVDWQYALISVAVVPVITIGGYLFFKQESKLWEEHEKEADKLNAIVQENLNGIRVVKALSAEEQEMEKFERQNKKKLAIGIRHVFLHVWYWPISDFLVLLQIIISIVAGGCFVLTAQISLGELLSFYTYIVMVAWPMRQVSRVLSQMGMATVAIGRIWEILDEKEEDYAGKSIEQPAKGTITFRNVSFRYDKKNPSLILKNISFEIAAGEKVALIGPTASGKSTIIKLLTRFYEPDEGEILIDGQPIAQISKKELRAMIGVVLQRAFLFSSSLRENIAYARNKVDSDEIHHVAEMAQASGIHHNLPEGFDTIIGEKGVMLSGGQKQRVSLARTLLANPQILVLDDVTSAVDTETEFEIFKSLNKPNADKTTIIISHRLTSIQQTDRVFVLEKGEITGMGPHEELIKSNRYYRQINELQSELEQQITIEKQTI